MPEPTFEVKRVLANAMGTHLRKRRDPEFLGAEMLTVFAHRTWGAEGPINKDDFSLQANLLF